MSFIKIDPPVITTDPLIKRCLAFYTNTRAFIVNCDGSTVLGWARDNSFLEFEATPLASNEARTVSQWLKDNNYNPTGLRAVHETEGDYDDFVKFQINVHF